MTDIDTIAAAIEDLGRDLRQSPNQFSFEVNMIGTLAVGGPGGPGIVASATGGSGSGTTIGFNAGGPTNQIQVEQAPEPSAMVPQLVAGWASTLDAVANELRKPDCDPGIIRAAVTSLKAQLVPSVVITAVNALVAVGLGA